MAQLPHYQINYSKNCSLLFLFLINCFIGNVQASHCQLNELDLDNEWNIGFDIEVGNGGIVIAAANSFDKNILYFKNSLNIWKPTFSNENSIINNIVWDGDKFIAIANDGIVYVSQNGVSWNNYSEIGLPDATDTKFLSSFYFKKTYIVLGDNGIWTSKNLINWNNSVFDNSALPFFGLTEKQHGEFAIVYGSDHMWKSKNGEEWFIDKYVSHKYQSIIFHDQSYIAIGSSGSIGISSERCKVE